MADILTTAQYKALKGITSSDYDTQLGAIIPCVNQFVEDYCQKKFGVGLYTEKSEGLLDIRNNYVFQVKNYPIQEIFSVDVHFRSIPTPLPVNLYYLDIFYPEGYCYYAGTLIPGILVIRQEYRDKFSYTITYSGGQAVPSPVTLAASTMVSDMFEYYNRVNTATVSGIENTNRDLKKVTIGDYGEEYSQGQDMYSKLHTEATGIVLTQTVKDLLAPYRKHGQNTFVQ